MPRLLMITTTAATLQAFLLPFADDFRRQGWQVAAAAGDTAAHAAISSHFDAVYDLPFQRRIGPELLQAAWRLRRIVAQFKPELIHVHTPVAAALARLALIGSRVPLVYTVHGFHYQADKKGIKNQLYLTIEHVLAPFTTHLITINPEDLAVAQRLAVPASYMPGIGVDPVQWRPDPQTLESQEALSKQLGIPASAPALLMIAEFNPDKRHSDLLQAFAQITPRYPQAYLLLAGQGPLQPTIAKQAAQLKIADQVRFLGHRRDIPALIQRATAIILPSVREGLPRSLLEAMSMSRPIVVSNVRGCRQLGAQGGLVYPAGDIDALAQHLAALLDQPEYAARLGQQGRQAILNQGYAVENILQAHRKLYDTLLAATT